MSAVRPQVTGAAGGPSPLPGFTAQTGLVHSEFCFTILQRKAKNKALKLTALPRVKHVPCQFSSVVLVVHGNLCNTQPCCGGIISAS